MRRSEGFNSLGYARSTGGSIDGVVKQLYKNFTTSNIPMATTQSKPTKKVARKAIVTAQVGAVPTVFGPLHLVMSSEARRDWKNVTARALAGERIAILIGKRAVALRPVELTYAEEEYGVNETQLDGKAQEILGRARKERAKGKTGSGSDLL